MNTAIYYPHIHPTTKWLKMAALCWDKVYRLVPPGWDRDSVTVQELDAALGGVLASVDITTVANLEVQRQFEQWLDERAETLKAGAWSSEQPEQEKTLEALYTSKYTTLLFSKLQRGGFVDRLEERGLAWSETKDIKVKIPDWEEDSFFENRRGIEGQARQAIPEPGSAHEQYEKLIEKAEKKRDTADAQGAEAEKKKAEQIRQQHLITVTDKTSITYLPKDIALHYLSLCASEVARDKRRDLVADGKQFTDSIFYKDELQGQIAAEVLQVYLPKDFSSLDPQRIAELREEFSLQRLQYQAAIKSIVDQITNSTSEGELESAKRRAKEAAEDNIETTKKIYQRARTQTMLTTLGIYVATTAPALAGFLTSALGIGILEPIGITAMLSLTTTKSFLDMKKATQEKNQSPWSYILELEKKLR